MANVGEKCRLRAVDFGQSFRSRPLALVIVGANDSGRDLAGQQFHKAPVIGVGGAVRIETRDEESEG